jgi:thiamine biosynthesis lipoprotein
VTQFLPKPINNMSEPENESSRRDTRREFLKGKSAVNALGSKISTPEPLDTSADSALRESGAVERQAAYLEQYSKNAMACEFEIFFNMHQYRQSALAVAAAFELIDQLEDQMTVYRSHSEVSQINRTASGEPFEVERHLFGVLQLAMEIHRETSGAFDMTAAGLTKLWRFDRRSGAIPELSEIEAVRQHLGSQHVLLDAEHRTIRFAKTGIEINLGGIGKGHALDRVAQRLLEAELDDFVIHGGQSSVLARGSSTGISDCETDEFSAGWQVGLSHPNLPAVRLAEITLRDQALGTSGTGRQGFFHQGKRYGHIIDPRTGWPASHFLSTTVIASSAARADALATGFFVMPFEEIEAYCNSNPDVGVILVLPSSTAVKKDAAKVSQKTAPGQILIQLFNLDERTVKIVS